MKILFAVVLAFVIATPASSMSDVQYRRARAVEQVVNGLQMLSDKSGFSETQKVQVASIESALFTLFYDVIADVVTDVENGSTTIEEYEKVRALRRALSIVVLTADISGFTESQVATMTELRAQSLAVVREIRSQIVVE